MLRSWFPTSKRNVNPPGPTIVVLSPDGGVLYANRAVLEYTGLTMPDVLAGDFLSRLFHPEDVVRLRDPRHEGLSHGVPFEIEWRARRHDGQYRWFLVRYRPLVDDQSRVLRWYATAIDIDDRKRAEQRTQNENLALREDIHRASMFEEIVGSSASLRAVLVQVAKVAPTDSTVLILGETGTGKELIARAIHKRSRRATKAFIRVNCAAIPQSLIASELFGHEKGAFTGALQRRLGRFEAADGGTILLDEIADLPAETQVALLRVLQEREFERVGSSHPIAVDVRVIVGTNQDLEAAVARGVAPSVSQRPDLFEATRYTDSNLRDFAFKTRFERLYPGTQFATHMMPYAYDDFNMIVEAFERGANPAVYLRNIRTYEGNAGTLTKGQGSGNFQSTPAVWEIERGKPALLSHQ